MNATDGSPVTRWTQRDYVAAIGAAVAALDAGGAGWASGRLSYSHVFRIRYRLLVERFGEALAERSLARSVPGGDVLAELRRESHDQLGIYPTDPTFLARFDRHWLASLAELDLIGLMDGDAGAGGSTLLHHLGIAAPTIDHLDQEPDRSIPEAPHHCFLPHLAGRRVLIVSPFGDLLAERARPELYEAVWARCGKRWFEPGHVDALTFPYGIERSTAERHPDALDLLASITAGLDRRDFDVALIGAAGLAVPIAAHVRRQGRVAIELGGHLQIVFGVLGARWRRQPDFCRRYVTDAWIDMPARYRPDAPGACDDGAYW